MCTGAVLFAGTRSTAPCTVQKSPLPSAAAVRRPSSRPGAAGLVWNRQARRSVTPGSGWPPAVVKTAASTSTE